MKQLVGTLALSAALMVAGEARAADQFDLKCEGVETLTDNKTTSYSDRISIDLKAGTFCWWALDCATSKKIANFDDRTITLVDDPQLDASWVINRMNGVERVKTPLREVYATCKPLTYSGPPKSLF